MGSMKDEEYTRRFLELLRYVPCLIEDKAKIHRFISVFLVAFNYRIEFDEPSSLVESIWKLSHYYEKSKHKSKTNTDWKGNGRNKGKWDMK